MPYTTVVPGTVITASWANANVRDQVVTPFASASARTAAVTAPPVGLLTALTDTKVWEGWDGSNYVQPVQLRVASSVRTTANTGTTTLFATGDQVSWTFKGGRRYRVEITTQVTANGSDQWRWCLIMKAGASVANTDPIIIERTGNIPTANVNYPVHAAIELTGYTDGQQYTIGGFAASTFGGHTLTAGGNSTEKSILTVYEIGV